MECRTGSQRPPSLEAEDRRVSNGVINEESGARMARRHFFQIFPGSVYSIKMVASVFDGIVVNIQWQCIRHRHTGPTPGIMVRGAIRYTSRSPLVCIYGTLKSSRYIFGVLRPVALPFKRALRNPTFKQDNARPHVAGIVRTFLATENVQLLPWSARSSDLSPIGNVWSMVDERLARHHTPVPTVDELWYRVEKLHGHLYLYMPSSLCLTQCPGV
ncbi:transposable element Tcb1 transposase [Trichonephila clavipes]|nr:transposable element Tcb1 transposase [Trichonephila clavipes]